MKPITLQLSVTLDVNSTAALIELLTLVVEQAIDRRTQAALTPTEHSSIKTMSLSRAANKRPLRSATLLSD
jgi:hypothetical protein